MRISLRFLSRPLAALPGRDIFFSCLAVLALLGADPGRLSAAAPVYFEDPFEAQDFAISGFAWNPGPNSARIGGNPAPGSATFSIMGAGFRDASGFDSDHMSRFVDYETQPITDLMPSMTFNDLKNMINSALNVWDAPSGFTNLGYVTDGNVGAGELEAGGGAQGDIRIAAWKILGSTALAHAFFPATESLLGPGGTIGGDVHIDADPTWVDNPNANVGQLDLYTVLVHELGHALGLQHSSNPLSVMYFSYSGGRRNLTADDIAGIQAIYGPPEAVPEPSAWVLAITATGTFSLWRLRTSRFGRRQRSLS